MDVAVGLFYEGGGREAADEAASETVGGADKPAGHSASETVFISSDSEEEGAFGGSGGASRSRPTRLTQFARSNAAVEAFSVEDTVNAQRSIFDPPPSRSTRQSTVVQMIHSDEDGETSPIFTVREMSDPFRAGIMGTGPAGGSERARRLADLFRPPYAIMFTGTFEMARRRARECARWLLVSLHTPTEFSCQTMNRDLWNSPRLQSFIQDNFVFFQMNGGSAEAQRYESFYPFDRLYPHTALIDPRTGERVETLLVASIAVAGYRTVEAEDMVALLGQFLSEHPLAPVGVARPAIPSMDYVTAATAGDGSDGERVSLRKRANTEPDVSEVSVGASISTGNASSTSALTGDASGASVLTEEMPEEPPRDAPNCTTIQFRLPDGSRLRRRYRLSDTVNVLYQTARVAIKSSDELCLQTHEGSLQDRTMTLETARLANALITIVK